MFTKPVFCIFLVALFTFCNATNLTRSPRFPALLIFGDSTVDAGNNNYIPTVFKATHLPYGIDFPGHVPTGRFSNGKLTPDIAASRLNIKQTVPPFLDPTLSDNDITTGVSFASAGSGYDDLTTVASGVIPLTKQIRMFSNYVNRLERVVGEKKSKEIIKDALVIISAGPNDFIFNYYDLPTRRLEFPDISSYQDFVQRRLENIVRELYVMGCRKMVVYGLPPMGCLPIQVSVKDPYHRDCVEDVNKDSVLYNQKLQRLLPQIEAALPGSKIKYGDVYDTFMEVLRHPGKYGFRETKRGCCGTGYVEAAFLCNVLSRTCSNHSEYVFWDSIHPTEAMYRYLADAFENHILPLLLSA